MTKMVLFSVIKWPCFRLTKTGNGIRATARIKNVDKDSVASWLDRASQHVEAVSRYLMVNLHFEAVQLDEFWSFVQKKKRSVHLWNDFWKPMVTGGSG